MGKRLILLLAKLYWVMSLLQVHVSEGRVISTAPVFLRFERKRQERSVATVLSRAYHKVFTVDHSLAKEIYPHNSVNPSSIAIPPSNSYSGGPARSVALPPSKSSSTGTEKKSVHGSAYSRYLPIIHHKYWHFTRKSNSLAPQPSYLIHPPSYDHQGQSKPPFYSPMNQGLSAPVPSPSRLPTPSLQPTISPLASSLEKIKTRPPSPVLVLPPPPPNQDCMWVTCTEPFTYTPSGSPCGCVWPIQVKIRLSIAIYKFFSSVSELAMEISRSVSLTSSQVRIMGADATSQHISKTTVLINLVPKGVKFDDMTAYLLYKKFWQKEVMIDTSLFGAYEVLYVHYPGLPPSPPSAPSSIPSIDDGPYTAHGDNGRIIKPLGVDVPRRKKEGLGGRLITIIVLSSFTAFIVFIGISWIILLKCSCRHQLEQTPRVSVSSHSKPSGARLVMYGNTRSSASMSFSSGTLIYTGSAKTFTLDDIEKATNKFDASRVLGEGGFGRVYRGVLDDGRDVAVKVLKRDDRHSGREFLAEVEMLSRLHHRNLVKLIGICIENQTRCLVYELVPNGSVESHLHAADKETDPLDWDARMKIALGAARGLAYLHEDSNPRVIHRDFKSSNILLEYDFTPKVSDFGLARTALDEGTKHISTHVMGTFGYLAPEYAMTGHLLVKSDVYSYGVVLLELLTGRKPVDLSQPLGQENLVSWARPLLSSKDGLEIIVDPVIRPNTSFDSISKVAAIASMCVQPEVSHRPFMGEVVQALKLVCCEFDDPNNTARFRSYHQEDSQTDLDMKICRNSDDIAEFSESHQRPLGYESSHGNNLVLSTSELLCTSLAEQEFESFRRHSSSGPPRTGKRRQFWQRLRSLSRGSVSEHGFSVKLWPGSH